MLPALTQDLIGHRLDTLPELLRMVFLLRHIDGLDVETIGERLGTPIDDVEWLLARAVRALAWGTADPPA